MKKPWLILIAQMVSVLWMDQAQAHRAIVNKEELQRWGFKPVQERVIRASKKPVIPYAKNSLEFPVELTKVENQFGAVMHQLQDYTKPDYFHAGVDIRTEPQQVIRTPVNGRIEAGYYAYTDSEDGSTEKHFLSLKDSLSQTGAPKWGERYFEVAVIDESGYRFEFHHVDRKTLSENILQKILSGGRVEKGEVVGFVIRWSGTNNGLEYHHLHYNIMSNEGLYINPFYVSKKISDQMPPVIRDIMVSTTPKHEYESRCRERKYLTVGELEEEANGYLVIEALDYISGKHFPNPPAKIKVYYGKNQTFTWDFTQVLADQNLFLPDIRDLYLRWYCSTKGLSMIGTLNYRFYVKVPIPPVFSGTAVIYLEDQVGNSTLKTIEIKGESI